MPAATTPQHPRPRHSAIRQELTMHLVKRHQRTSQIVARERFGIRRRGAATARSTVRSHVCSTRLEIARCQFRARPLPERAVSAVDEAAQAAKGVVGGAARHLTMNGRLVLEIQSLSSQSKRNRGIGGLSEHSREAVLCRAVPWASRCTTRGSRHCCPFQAAGAVPMHAYNLRMSAWFVR